MTPARIAVLERERATSHMNWLAAFGYILGYAWMEREAAHLHHALVGADGASEVVALQPTIERFLKQTRRTPLLERRLRGIGMVEGVDDGVRGPVARASGFARDARIGDNGYTRLGFKPIMVEGGDALARLQVRMEEIVWSLSVVRAVADAVEPTYDNVQTEGGRGEATLETPRGAATLAVVVEDGMVQEARLDTPSTAHFGLIDRVVLHQELGDALVGVASLDLSPWEASR